MISVAEFEQQWLEDIRAGNPSTVELGKRFAAKILRDWHEIDETSAEIILCDGAGDGGIDAAVFCRADPTEGIDGDTWMVIQSKYGTALAGPETITTEAQKLFSTLEGNRQLSAFSHELVLRLQNFISNVGPKDRLEYIVATTRKLSPEELGYLNDVRVLGRAKFGECFDVDSVSIETIYNKVIEDLEASTTSLTVELATNITASTDDLLIGATSLRDIFAFMQDYRTQAGDLDLLYEKNVRKFLGNKRKVNKGIERTLEQHPERFGLYNNGITIVAERLGKGHENKLSLVNPFIVNGCQTTKSIWSVLQRKLNSGGNAPSDSQKEWESRLDKGVVVTKIVVIGAGGEELLTETTRYTNSQNTVGEKDFIALEKDFREWAPMFNARYGVFLEIQRGAWEARKAFQRQNPAVSPQFTEAANAFDLLKAYAAGWLEEPGIAFGKNPPFAPGGSLFNKIINDPNFGIDSLYAAFQVQKLATSYGFGRGAQFPTRGQTRFLFIMVTISLIKDHMLHLNIDRSNTAVVAAVNKLAKADTLRHFGDAAVQVIDEYLTRGADDSIFVEPEFEKTGDLNAFLKSEKLGKSDEFSPGLRTQLALARRVFRKTPGAGEVTSVLVDTD